MSGRSNSAGVAVRRAPRSRIRGAGRDVDSAQFGGVGGMAEVVAKRRLQSEHFFDERTDELRCLAYSLLQVVVDGEYVDRVAEQTGRGLTACAEQRVHDDESLDRPELALGDGGRDDTEDAFAALIDRVLELVAGP